MKIQAFLAVSLSATLLFSLPSAQATGGRASGGPANGGTVSPPAAPGGGARPPRPNRGNYGGCPVGEGGAYRPAPAPTPYNGPGGASRPAGRRPRTGGGALAGAHPVPARPTIAPTTPHSSWFLPQTVQRSSERDWNRWWVWWSFNRDAYLSVRAELARRPSSHTQSNPNGIGSAFELHATPVFNQMSHEGEKIEILREFLIAGALADARCVLDRQVSSSARHFGKLHYPELKDAALLSLGIRGKGMHVGDLMEVLRNTAAGRQLLDVQEISVAWRSMAAYALGLASSDLSASRKITIARVLMDEVLQGSDETRNAAVMALGLVELGACAGSENSDGPHTCPGAQTGALVDVFLDASGSLELRAQALTALARIASPFEAPDQRQAIAELIIGAAADKEREELVRSAILAMGLFGDGDEDAADAAIRAELGRLVNNGPKELRGLALISLAQVASRRAENEDSLKETTKLLLQQLARGRGDQKSWAALAIGVLGNRLALAGRSLDNTVVFGLRERFHGAKSPDLAAACALGLALVRDENDATKKLLARRYARSKDPFFRTYASLALGVLSVTEATEALNEAVLEGDLSAAVALRLMGQDEVVTQLTQLLEGPRQDKLETIQVLGRLADPRAIAPLARLMGDRAKTPELRAQATRALGQLVDEGLAHWTAPYANNINYRALTWSLTDPATQRGLLDFRPRE